MKYLVIFVFMICSFSAKAQQGYTYFEVAGGYLFDDVYAGEAGIELGKRYHKSIELLLNVNHNTISSIEENKSDSISTSFLAGVAYKPLIIRHRNIALNWRFSLTAGTDWQRFLAAISGGLELNFFLANDAILFIRQKNEIVFWADDHFRFGGLAGVKLPLN